MKSTDIKPGMLLEGPEGNLVIVEDVRKLDEKYWLQGNEVSVLYLIESDGEKTCCYTYNLEKYKVHLDSGVEVIDSSIWYAF